MCSGKGQIGCGLAALGDLSHQIPLPAAQAVLSDVEQLTEKRPKDLTEQALLGWVSVPGSQ